MLFSSRFVFLVATNFLASFAPISGQGDCGLPDPKWASISPAIIGGEATEPGIWPWQLSIEVFDGVSRTLVCGGAIVDASWGVTAAQCVFTQSFQILAIAGLHNRSEAINDEEQLRTIDPAQIFLHPNFDPATLANDIALIRFNEPFDFNVTGIKPICLPPSNTTEYIQNPNCFVTGWGVTEVGGSFSDTLLKTGIDLIGDVNCGLILNRVVRAPELCGYDQVSHETGPCQGDFGAPLSCLVDANFFLAGVASLIDPGCNGRIPQIFSDVPIFIDWIRGVINAKNGVV